MKKLMIAAAIVCAATLSQAAVTKWKTTNTNGILYDGYKNTDGSYEKAIQKDTIVYLIAASSDTTYGITQAKLVEAFQGATEDNPFNLASYAMPTTAGSSSTSTGESGLAVIAAAQNGTDSSGDFHSATGVKYQFYYAALVNDGENDYLYVSDLSLATQAKASTQTVSLSMASKVTNSDKLISGEGFSTSGWYAVPEPTSGLLLLLGVAGLALKRKRA